ncbi:MAG: VgrG-related protein [Chloroflexi bacterium]|nr:VgrG-related protein [Chloroflexota bacterium]
MADTTLLLSQFYIKFAGTEASEPMMLNLVEATVENSLHLPDVATLTFHDPDGKWVDDSNVSPGKALTITAKVGETTHELFDGEIVELESDFFPGERRLMVRAFDRLHRLARGRQVRSFVNMNDGDIIQKIASEVGLTAKVGPTQTVHPYVLQDNVTDLEFLRGRAGLLGYLLFVHEKTLHCEPYGSQTNALTIHYGEDLREFHPRLTTVDQVSTATATGWDPKQAQAIVGRASEAQGAPTVGEGTQGGTVAQKAFNINASIQVADRPIRTQAMADRLAQASLDRRAGRFIEAEGTTRGNPQLIAAASVDLQGLGQRFSGKYFVTSSTHKYSSEHGYVTQFTVSGFQPSSLLSLLAPERDGLASPRIGLVVGVVTDNNDPDGLGRVKVLYPWLSQDHASDWARVVIPGGGTQRGMQFLPEVNDEVLVGFEQGDINFPYVLGGLWNGKNAPPSKSGEVISGGKVNKRVIRSRTGHIITLDDSDNEASITIVDNTGKNKVFLDSMKNKLTVHLEGDMLFEAPQGNVSIKGKTINVEATDALKVKGMSVDTEADTSVNVKAGTDMKVSGLNTELSGSVSAKLKSVATDVTADAKLTLSGSAMTQVSGGIIQVG